jgi:hypothetical protein
MGFIVLLTMIVNWFIKIYQINYWIRKCQMYHVQNVKH